MCETVHTTEMFTYRLKNLGVVESAVVTRDELRALGEYHALLRAPEDAAPLCPDLPWPLVNRIPEVHLGRKRLSRKQRCQ